MAADKLYPLWTLCVTIVALLVAMLPMPYGYYIILRIICCATFVYCGLVVMDSKRSFLAYVSLAFAIVYNPVIRIHATKAIWYVVNALSVVLSVVLLVVLLKTRIGDRSTESEDQDEGNCLRK